MSNFDYVPGTGTDQFAGSESSATDANGDIVVTHGSNTTPERVFCQLTTNANYTLSVRARAATTFTVRVYDGDTGASVDSTTVAFDWLIHP